MLSFWDKKNVFSTVIGFKKQKFGQTPSIDPWNSVCFYFQKKWFFKITVEKTLQKNEYFKPLWKKAFSSPKNDYFHVHTIKQFPIKANGLAV